MMKFLLIAYISIFFSIQKFERQEETQIRIFNDSKYKIEKLKLTFKGEETLFEDILPNTYSDPKTVKGFWKDNCYDITVFKKRLFKENFWAHTICFPVDHIGDKKIEKGKYVLKLKINQQNEDQIKTETEYISDN